MVIEALFLICFIVHVKSYNPFYIYSSTDSLAEQQYDIFSKYVKDKDPSIIITGKTYTGQIENFKTVFKTTIEEDKADLVFVFCTEEIISYSKLLISGENILLWCTNAYNYGLCDHNIIAGNSIVSPLKESIYFFLNIYNS